MRALTLWPEWAWAICHLGKRIENRSYPLRAELAHTELAIHAGKLVGGTEKPYEQREALDALCEMASRAGWEPSPPDFGPRITFTRGAVTEVLTLATLPRGAIVALTRVEHSAVGIQDPWAVPGLHNWRLSNVRQLTRPVACRGQQMVWSVPAAAVLAVQHEVAAFDRILERG